MTRPRILSLGLLALVAGCASGPRGAAASGEFSAAELDKLASTPGRKIVGRVVDVATGQPMSMVEVTAVGAGKTVAVHTGADGVYQLLPLAEGSYAVTARYTTLHAQFDGVTVLGDTDTTLNFQLDSRPGSGAAGNDNSIGHARTGVIEGRLVDEVSGQEFPGVIVTVLGDQMRDTPYAISGDDGRYRIPGLPAGTYSVLVYYNLIDKGTIEVRRSNIVVRHGETTRVDLEIDTNLQR